MKLKTLIFSFLILIVLKGKSQVLFEIYNDTVKDYVFSGGDEFNEKSLNDTLWKNGLGGRRVLMVQDLAFEPKNVSLQKGLVVFTADKNDSTYILRQSEIDSNNLRKRNISLRDQKFQVKYSAGGIVSRKKYHYGIYELRFKVEEGTGIWPAFWFYGGNKNEEIDVFEMKGERNNDIHVDTHCPSGCAHGYQKSSLSLPRSYGGWVRMSEHLHEGFNNVMLDWREDEVIWLLNGRPFAYFRGRFSNPMNIFLNTSVAQTGEGFSPGPDSTTQWPNHYYVDYLRIWSVTTEPKDLKLLVGDFTSSSQFGTKNAKPLKKHSVVYSKKKFNGLQGIISVTRPATNVIAIKALGCINEVEGKVVVSGATTKKEIALSENENSVTIEGNDSSVTLEVFHGGRRFTRVLLLPR